MKRKLPVLLAIAALALGGCGTMMANNKEMQKARLHLQTGDLAAALEAEKKRDDLCGVLDRAVLLQLQGDPSASNAEFDRALGLIRGFEDRAVISATEAGRGAGSLLLNDKVLEYQGEGFEKVLIHALKARNYLLLGDESAARVEIRNANLRQDEERRRHEEEIEAARTEASSRSFNFDDRVQSAFAPTSEVLSRIDNIYQNPLATYLSGVVYELNGDFEDAFVDFRRAWAMAPSPLLAAEVSRLGTRLGRAEELRELGLDPGQQAGKAGNTLVMLDNGLAPARAELKFPIPAGNTIAAVAVPITEPVPTNLSEALILDADGTELGRTTMMVDVEAMSVRNLRDRYPAILTRQAIRLAAKIAASNAAVAAANQQSAGAGLLVQVFTSVGNVVSEQADLRAWYQLPRSMHVARIDIPDGTNEVTLRMLDLQGLPMADVQVPVVDAAGPIKVIAARYVNGRTIAMAPGSSQVAGVGPDGIGLVAASTGGRP